jgi:hypothetical protein
MTTTAPRRRVLRPRIEPASHLGQTAKVQRWRGQLAKNRNLLKRWRALTTIERLQASIPRIKRRIGSAP